MLWLRQMAAIPPVMRALGLARTGTCHHQMEHSTGQLAATTTPSPPRSSKEVPTSKRQEGRSRAHLSPTPLATDAGTCHGSWSARGARIESLWQAAALGDQPRADEFLNADPGPTNEDQDDAFWHACHGGLRRMAEYLLGRGASINATPSYSDTTPIQAAGEPDTRRQALVGWLREQGATQG